MPADPRGATAEAPAPAGTAAPDPEPLLRVDSLVKHYPLTRGVVFRRRYGAVQAVDGVSFDLRRGETLGLVGESGCGKTSVAKTLMRLHDPTSGHAYLDGTDVFSLSRSQLRVLRRRMQMIFQDPYSSLNPRMTVGDILGEAWEVHPDVVPRDQRRDRARDLLERVGLAGDDVNRYPHQFSGGQRQRVGIARALTLNPDIIVCDEPVSALDVSVQAQVVNLLEDLQDEFGLAYIFVAHDLSVVRHISDRVAVMYLGRIVEIGTRDDIYLRPTHPYTQALLSAVPVPDPTLRGRRERIILEGDLPDPANPPSGCRFRTRCWKAQDICAVEDPPLVDRGDGHPSACHFAEVKESVVAQDLAADFRRPDGQAPADS
ncbi:MAG: ABC transporter ATP-binding protein [Kineosporiaceae bacterium]